MQLMHHAHALYRLLVASKFIVQVMLVLQKIDKELESALATLEKEKEEALKDLDAQVLAIGACWSMSLSGHKFMLFVQVGKLSGEILARVLPEGVKL